MRLALTGCISVLLLASVTAKETPVPAPATLADLAWIAGTWRGSEKEAASEEVWMAPAGDCMVGMWRLVVEGKLQLTEHMQIVQEPAGPVLHLRHFDRSGVGWEDREKPLVVPLVSVGEGLAVFASPTLRIAYERRRDGTLSVEVVHGDAAPSTHTFRRAP